MTTATLTESEMAEAEAVLDACTSGHEERGEQPCPDCLALVEWLYGDDLEPVGATP